MTTTTREGESMSNDPTTNTYLGEIAAVLHEIRDRHCELARAINGSVEEAMQRTGEAIRGSAETVTVALTRDVAERFTPEQWREVAGRLRQDGWFTVGRLTETMADALEAADTPPEPTTATQDAPTGRIGWLQRYKDSGSSDTLHRHYLVREVDDGWSRDGSNTPDYRAEFYPDAVFTPIATLPEGYVAVEREDLHCAVTVLDALDPFLDPANEPWLIRLRAALERSQS